MDLRDSAASADIHRFPIKRRSGCFSSRHLHADASVEMGQLRAQQLGLSSQVADDQSKRMLFFTVHGWFLTLVMPGKVHPVAGSALQGGVFGQ